MSARAGGEIARLPLGEAASFRAGAPYWVVHRADLQAALQAEVNDHPDIELRLGCQFEGRDPHAKGLTVVQRRGNSRQQDLAVALIGADGIWSSVRNHLFPDVQPQFSGLIAMARDARCDRVAAGIYLAAGPALDGTERASGCLSDLGWAPDQRRGHRAGDLEPARLECARRTERGQGSVRITVAATARMLIAPSMAGENGRCLRSPMSATGTRIPWALLGDAAHAMLPFAAQGAGMAIEDAAVLASALSDSAGENVAGIPAALKRYTRLRRSRVLRVQRLARRQGRIYHLTGPGSVGARPRDQGDGPESNAGAAGLDLRLAGVSLSAFSSEVDRFA